MAFRIACPTLSLWYLLTLVGQNCLAFVPASITFHNSKLSSRSRMSAASIAPASTTEYDIVKVDLADGRDYPIYIGAGFEDDEGTKCLSLSCGKGFVCAGSECRPYRTLIIFPSRLVQNTHAASSLLQSHVHGSKVLIVTNDRIAPMHLQKYKDLLLKKYIRQTTRRSYTDTPRWRRT
jgi:hypothetical protein